MSASAKIPHLAVARGCEPRPRPTESVAPSSGGNGAETAGTLRDLRSRVSPYQLDPHYFDGDEPERRSPWHVEEDLAAAAE